MKIAEKGTGAIELGYVQPKEFVWSPGTKAMA
jgi:hypothetical protein